MSPEMGAENRGQLLDPAVTQLIEQARTEGSLRQTAAAVIALAVDRTEVGDRRLAAALELLSAGRYGDSSERSSVQALTQELDEAAWDLQARGDQDAYVVAFRKARAASAVWFALGPDAADAATEAAYEAAAAIDDVEALRSAIGRALG